MRGRYPLDLEDPSKSRVWRVELRLGKRALLEIGGIRGWSSFYENLQAQLVSLTEAVQLCVPRADSNRHRWRPDPMWHVTSDLVRDSIFEGSVDVDEEALHDAELFEKQQQFLSLVTSHLVTLAVLQGVNVDNFSEFLEGAPARVEHFLEMHQRGLSERMADSATKYGNLL